MLGILFGSLALLSFAVAVVAFTVWRDPAAYRRLAARAGKQPHLPDPEEESREARNALTAALILLGLALFFAYLSFKFA